MSLKPVSSKRMSPVVLTFIVGLFALALCVFSSNGKVNRQPNKDNPEVETSREAASRKDQKFDPFNYLPVGSSIDNLDKDVAYADLDGDGNKEIIIFYTLYSEGQHKANILVVRQVGAGYSRFWEDTYSGSSGFADPTGVYEVNKNGKPQIVAYRTVGASCPGKLDIYQFAGGTIEKITGDWADECQSDLEVKDINGDGADEIIFRKLKYGVNRDIYSWNGKSYIRRNSQFVKEYSSELGKLTEAIYSQESLPVSARVTWCRQACEMYILQQHYAGAVELCNDVLRLIDDPSLTRPSTDLRGDEPDEIKNRVAAYFELEKIQGKGAVYRLIGDIQKAAGNLKQATSDYDKARMLEAKAREIESKLPH